VSGAPRFEELHDHPLESLRFDLGDARVTAQIGPYQVEWSGVRATTLLSPWDGAPGQVEWLQLLEEGDGECCLELRVRFGAIPRVFRIVCRSIEIRERPDVTG
jgi:hypothetical protein